MSTKKNNRGLSGCLMIKFPLALCYGELLSQIDYADVVKQIIFFKLELVYIESKRK